MWRSVRPTHPTPHWVRPTHRTPHWVRPTHPTPHWVRPTHPTPHWVRPTHPTPHWVRPTHRTPHWVRPTHPTPHWGAWDTRLQARRTSNNLRRATTGWGPPCERSVRAAADLSPLRGRPQPAIRRTSPKALSPASGSEAAGCPAVHWVAAAMSFFSAVIRSSAEAYFSCCRRCVPSHTTSVSPYRSPVKSRRWASSRRYP